MKPGFRLKPVLRSGFRDALSEHPAEAGTTKRVRDAFPNIRLASARGLFFFVMSRTGQAYKIPPIVSQSAQPRLIDWNRCLQRGRMRESMKMSSEIAPGESMKMSSEIAPGESSKVHSIVETYQEGLRLFMGQGELNETLVRLVRNLEQHAIDYMVVGAIALIAHGYKRFTEDIDLVMTAESLDTFHRELIGLGYSPKFPGARKRLRSTVDGVSIDVITSGEYPGDGKPKPVAVPRPEQASIEIDGIRIVTLEKLIELKLASGMTAPHRLRDLADVQELIKIRQLDAGFAERLDPYVRDKYFELWDAVASAVTFEEPGSESRDDHNK